MHTTGDFIAPAAPEATTGLAEAAAPQVGADPLDAAEAAPVALLLAALLAPALGDAAPAVAAALIANFGSLPVVLTARPAQLGEVSGMVPSAVRLVETTAAIGRRAAREGMRARDLLDDPAAVENYLRSTLRCRPTEEAHGLFLDTSNRLICDFLLSRGIVNHTPLYPREVVRHALTLNASALILVYNHPSGDPSLSLADIACSRRIAQALAAVNVALHDHLMVGDNRIASMRALGVFW
jgi:DNA repair protein RadC